jgi:diphthine-ammonia ligase
MKLAVLFSGGKDSTLALHKVAEKERVVCLITLVSESKESYMFHTPNVDLTSLQAEALGLPLIKKVTEGKPEKELKDLEEAIGQAVKDFKIEGVVTGAVESVYQSKRVQNICDRLRLSHLSPLWKKNQKAMLEELIKEDFKVIISGVFAYPLDATWLGKELNIEVMDRLLQLREEFGLSPSGEGGEIETTVLDAPMFRSRVEVVDFTVEARGNSGVLIIKKARLVHK